MSPRTLGIQALCAQLAHELPLGIIVYWLEREDDPESLTLAFANAAASRIVGFDLGANIGKRQRELFPNVPPERRAAYAKAALTGVGWSDDSIVYSDPRTPEIHYAILAVPLAERCVALVFENITERRRAQQALRNAHAELEIRVQERTAELGQTNERLRAEIGERIRADQVLRRTEEQLRHAQKMDAVGRLAGGMAHDFNNMLLVIMTSVDFILGQADASSSIREDARDIKVAAERASTLTQQLLAFSRQQLVAAQIIDVNHSLTKIESMLRRLIGAHIDLVIRPSAAAKPVRADAGHLDQIVVNLAVNARDAMPNGGTLTIETALVELDEQYARDHLGVEPGPHTMLAVSDTGEGIAPESIERVFEPFFTTKGPGRGTGLGLSTVYGIVKQAGGSVWLYSELGKGTTFKIYLPVAKQAAATAEAKAPSDGVRGGEEVILLVEDDDLVRRAAREVLRRQGYSVIEARSAEEALLLCERWHGTIHAMVSDVVMPKVSGPELTERLREKRPELRVLFMSGYTDETVVERARFPAGAAFLQKPFTPDVLARRVRDLLDGT